MKTYSFRTTASVELHSGFYNADQVLIKFSRIRSDDFPIDGVYFTHLFIDGVLFSTDASDILRHLLLNTKHVHLQKLSEHTPSEFELDVNGVGLRQRFEEGHDWIKNHIPGTNHHFGLTIQGHTLMHYLAVPEMYRQATTEDVVKFFTEWDTSKTIDDPTEQDYRQMYIKRTKQMAQTLAADGKFEEAYNTLLEGFNEVK